MYESFQLSLLVIISYQNVNFVSTVYTDTSENMCSYFFSSIGVDSDEDALPKGQRLTIGYKPRVLTSRSVGSTPRGTALSSGPRQLSEPIYSCLPRTTDLTPQRHFLYDLYDHYLHGNHDFIHGGTHPASNARKMLRKCSLEKKVSYLNDGKIHYRYRGSQRSAPTPEPILPIPDPVEPVVEVPLIEDRKVRGKSKMVPSSRSGRKPPNFRRRASVAVSSMHTNGTADQGNRRRRASIVPGSDLSNGRKMGRRVSARPDQLQASNTKATRHMQLPRALEERAEGKSNTQDTGEWDRTTSVDATKEKPKIGRQASGLGQIHEGSRNNTSNQNTLDPLNNVNNSTTSMQTRGLIRKHGRSSVTADSYSHSGQISARTLMPKKPQEPFIPRKASNGRTVNQALTPRTFVGPFEMSEVERHRRAESNRRPSREVETIVHSIDVDEDVLRRVLCTPNIPFTPKERASLLPEGFTTLITRKAHLQGFQTIVLRIRGADHKAHTTRGRSRDLNIRPEHFKDKKEHEFCPVFPLSAAEYSTWFEKDWGLIQFCIANEVILVGEHDQTKGLLVIREELKRKFDLYHLLFRYHASKSGSGAGACYVTSEDALEMCVESQVFDKAVKLEDAKRAFDFSKFVSTSGFNFFQLSEHGLTRAQWLAGLVRLSIIKYSNRDVLGVRKARIMGELGLGLTFERHFMSSIRRSGLREMQRCLKDVFSLPARLMGNDEQIVFRKNCTRMFHGVFVKYSGAKDRQAGTPVFLSHKAFLNLLTDRDLFGPSLTLRHANAAFFLSQDDRQFMKQHISFSSFLQCVGRLAILLYPEPDTTFADKLASICKELLSGAK